MTKKLWSLMCAGALLSMGTFAACGGEEDACSGDNDCKGERICQSGECVDPASTSNNMTPSNNTPGNNTTTPTNATCAQTCTKVVSCEPSITQDVCEMNCNTNITQAQRNCVTNAATCADATVCLNSSGNNTTGNNNTDGKKALGASCDSSDECDSEYCRTPAGAFEGKCAVNDFGNMCQMGGDCEYNGCLFRNNTDDFGYCTTNCDSFTDCPTFWKCEEVGNAAGKYCIQ